MNLRGFFVIRENGKVEHNCNGSLNFTASVTVDEKTIRLLHLAILEGERRKASEIAKAIGLK